MSQLEHRPETDTTAQAVIVEITQDGAARIRECPPGVVVMVVQRGVIPDEDGQQRRKRSIAAGRSNGSHCGLAPEQERRCTEVSEIPVQFPG